MPTAMPAAASATPAGSTPKQREAHGRPFSLVLDLPPLGALVLKPFPPAPPVSIEVMRAAEPKRAEHRKSVRTEGASDDVAATDSTR